MSYITVLIFVDDTEGQQPGTLALFRCS